MPQLSVETFVTQYFWLLIIFFSFLIISTLYVMPKIAAIKKTRVLLQNFDTIEEESQRSDKLLSSHKC